MSKNKKSKTDASLVTAIVALSSVITCAMLLLNAIKTQEYYRAQKANSNKEQKAEVKTETAKTINYLDTLSQKAR
ncbi:MAG: hypothetical protein IKZ34_02705 [Alphaproteobacteria bacterium]|nr:hypothetical protein [Alphaproteobacteria bacterium]